MVYKFKSGTKELLVPKTTETLMYRYDLGSSINLNNITQEGYYHQAANINTSVSLNYPTTEAGLLTTINRQYIYQTYQTYTSSGYYYRSCYNGTWYAWKRVPNNAGDTFTGAINASYFNAANDQGLKSNGITLIYGNNGVTYLPNQPVVIKNNLTANNIFNSDWYRSVGTVGWYSQSYGGGFWMTDATWIRTYGNKGLYCDSTILAETIQANRYKCSNTNELIFTSSDMGLYFNWSKGNSINFYKFCNSNQNGGAVHASSFNNYSDRKLKDNIKDINKAKEFILSLKPIQYTLKSGESKQKRKHMGFIAQEVSETIKTLNIDDLSIVSAMVKEISKDDLGNDKIRETYFDDKVDDDQLEWSLNYIEFIAPMVATIQSQQKEIDELKEQIKLLINEVFN